MSMKHYHKYLLVGLLFLANCATAEEWKEKDVNGFHYRWGKPHIPERIINFKNPKAHVPTVPKDFVEAQDFVPTGLYVGDFGEAVWDCFLTRLVEHHGNAYYINGSCPKPYPPGKYDSASKEGLAEIARRASRLGVKIHYQNSASDIRWPARITDKTPREEVYKKVEKWATEGNFLSSFATDPELRNGLLAWAIHEELDEETTKDPLLLKCRNEIFKKLDPCHPLITLLMSNSLNIQEILYEKYKDIPIICIDPYFSNGAIGRGQNGSKFFVRAMSSWQDMAVKHGAKLWIVMACFSENNYEPEKEPGGWLMVVPEEMNFNCWTGLAYGSTGFYIFLEYNRRLWGRSAFTQFDWKPTEEYLAAVRFFRVVRKLEPFISKWSSEGKTQYDGSFVKGRMKHPDFNGKFDVIANTNTFVAMEYIIDSNHTFINLDTFENVKGKISLDPGMGVVLFSGDKQETKKVKQLCGPPAKTLKAINFSPVQIQTWTTDSKDEDMLAGRAIAKEPVTFGGKGGIPWLYSEEEMQEPPFLKVCPVREKDPNVKIPTRAYWPSKPGPGENMLFMRWNLSSLAKRNIEIESAVFDIKSAKGIKNGKLGIYPVVGDGNDLLNSVMEFMPRWEIDRFEVKPDGSLRIEIAGIVQEWINGDTPNKGLLMVYYGWPDSANAIEVTHIEPLKIKYRQKTE